MVGIYTFPIITLLGFVLSSIWLVFFLLEDRAKPEPRLLITKTFAIGMISAFAAIGMEKLFGLLCSCLSVEEYSILSISGNALIEEVIKFAVVFIFVGASRHFDEPIDRMIYMITAALGFATVENFFFFSTAASIAELAGITILRFVGATLMHALSSGMLGYFWAKQRLFIGVVVATVIHTVFNFLILASGPERWPIVFLLLLSFILFYEFDKIKQYYHERKKY
ncbi:MAG: PrsW family glutamic-type intramembrane protease [Candidatus Colwellbacteria bacterium]|nr:PrsW family glutamic-type intramembrane protease [Candidatus Colwellbacteria bacterium]